MLLIGTRARLASAGLRPSDSETGHAAFPVALLSSVESFPASCLSKLRLDKSLESSGSLWSRFLLIDDRGFDIIVRSGEELENLDRTKTMREVYKGVLSADTMRWFGLDGYHGPIRVDDEVKGKMIT